MNDGINDNEIVLSSDGDLVFSDEIPEEVPEGLRVTVPEPELRRRTVYGFRRDYPDSDSPYATHSVPFATLERRQKRRRIIGIVVCAVLAFCAAYILTAAAALISEAPI